MIPPVPSMRVKVPYLPHWSKYHTVVSRLPYDICRVLASVRLSRLDRCGPWWYKIIVKKNKGCWRCACFDKIINIVKLIQHRPASTIALVARSWIVYSFMLLLYWMIFYHDLIRLIRLHYLQLIRTLHPNIRLSVPIKQNISTYTFSLFLPWSSRLHCQVMSCMYVIYMCEGCPTRSTF